MGRIRNVPPVDAAERLTMKPFQAASKILNLYHNLDVRLEDSDKMLATYEAAQKFLDLPPKGAELFSGMAPQKYLQTVSLQNGGSRGILDRHIGGESRIIRCGASKDDGQYDRVYHQQNLEVHAGPTRDAKSNAR